MEDDTLPLELMEIIFPHTKRSDSNICAECGEEILPSTQNFNIEAGRVHKECFNKALKSSSKVIPMIPIGCESVEAWRNPSF